MNAESNSGCLPWRSRLRQESGMTLNYQVLFEPWTFECLCDAVQVLVCFVLLLSPLDFEMSEGSCVLSPVIEFMWQSRCVLTTVFTLSRCGWDEKPLKIWEGVRDWLKTRMEGLLIFCLEKSEYFRCGLEILRVHWCSNEVCDCRVWNDCVEDWRQNALLNFG